MVSHLLNIDEDLAKKVGKELRLEEMPQAAEAAKPTRKDLKASPALSILKNVPKSFAGRRVGVLLTDGADADMLEALKAALKKEGAAVKLIAPEVGGIKASDGKWHPADERLEGGPSVLFDAVVLLTAEEAVEGLASRPAARDFVADALAHKKFIGYAPPAKPLLMKAGAPEKLDDGCIPLDSEGDCARFVTSCRKLRYWERK
jgi:catalase